MYQVFPQIHWVRLLIGRQQIAFTKNEGGMMLVGDDPWTEFYRLLEKIFIYSCKLKKLNPRNKLHSPIECDGVLSIIEIRK